MNVKRLLPLAAVLLSASFTASAQQSQYDFVIETNPYLTKANPSYFDRFDGKKIATADIYAGKGNGAIIPIEGSADSFEAGAGTEAFVKISDRIAFYGKLSYSYFHGNGMGGQILFNPEYNAVNFLESADTTRGVKVRETYDLTGGLTYRFNSRFSAGVRVDYRAGDQTKLKDPRFINYLMDLDIKAGLNYSPSEKWDLGFTAFFRNDVEDVYGHIYGTTDKQYLVYTDMGGWWGVMEQLDGDYNYMPTGSLRPYVNDHYGISLDVNHLSEAKWFNTLTASYRTGYWGNNLTSQPRFFEHKGFDASYDGVLMMGRRHKVSFSAGYSLLFNSQNAYEYNTPTGKETVVVYKGQTRILERHDITAALSYRFFADDEGHYRPEYELGAEADFFYRMQTTTFYPDYRDYDYARINARIMGERSFFGSKNVYTPGIALFFRTGFGRGAVDGSYGGGTTRLVSFDAWMSSQFEYETAPRMGAEPSLSYIRVFNPKLALEFSLKDSFSVLLREPQYLKGRLRNDLLFTVGINF